MHVNYTWTYLRFVYVYTALIYTVFLHVYIFFLNSRGLRTHRTWVKTRLTETSTAYKIISFKTKKYTPNFSNYWFCSNLPHLF